MRTPESDASRPIYTIQLKPDPHVDDPVRALRGALKVILRRFGLKCISIEETRK